MSAVLVDRALERARTRSVTEATHELLFDLFDGANLERAAQDALTAISETATAIGRGSVPTAGAAVISLGDNHFQCPHCAEAFEGEPASACPACKRPLAASRVVIEVQLGDARLWLRPTETIRDQPSVNGLEWMRVESGSRWFELLDEHGRVAAERQLPSEAALLPNVSVVALRDGGRSMLVHATKYDIHVVEGDQRRSDGKGSTAELTLRELTNVLYPDAPPEAPSGKAIAQKGHAANEAAEAAIASDVEHADAYSVYADWLQGHGDPRGELIALQLAGKQDEARQLLEQHAPHFYGRVAELTYLLVTSPYSPFGRSTEWKWGYLERLWISNKTTKTRDEHDVPQALANLLDHPSCKFLRELSVGIVTSADNSYDEIARVIGERELPHLHTLILGDFHSEETELNWSNLGDISAIYPAVPNLRRLTLRSGSMTVGAIELPKLEALTVVSGGFDLASLTHICEADWPALTTLSLQLGRDEVFTRAHLQPIFDGAKFPKVTHLGLGNSTITDEICRGLAGSAIASRLVSLDLSQGTLGDDGARALAAGTYPKLAHLDVSSNWLTDAGVAILQKLAKEVEVADQSDDDGNPDDRYIGAYE